MSLLDAEVLYGQLLQGVRPLLGTSGVLVGIRTGGAWLAERLHADLGLPGRPGAISSTLHRDDFGSRGLAAASGATDLPFAVEGSRILLIDDVLSTGRTLRAVLNELFDFGRPASVALAVLVDRGGRELPVAAAFAAAQVALSDDQRLSLVRAPNGRLSFALDGQGSSSADEVAEGD